MAAYEITIVEKPSWVHAIVEGDRTPENALRFLQDVSAFCEKNGRTAALLEMRFSGPSLDPIDVFHVISQRSPQGAKLRRIAYVQAGDTGMARFAETVALNRGVNVRLFDSVAAAEEWLAT